ncbi:MAG: hypothetical protein HY313_07355, partial [Acidobacteria bacterium]|nr:hypothetical protein [Acidobacteriota bacterium]
AVETATARSKEIGAQIVRQFSLPAEVPPAVTAPRSPRRAAKQSRIAKKRSR